MTADPADPFSAVPSGGADAAGPFCLEASLLGPLLVPHGAGRAPAVAAPDDGQRRGRLDGTSPNGEGGRDKPA
jgi:hypothetical protein